MLPHVLGGDDHLRAGLPRGVAAHRHQGDQHPGLALAAQPSTAASQCIVSSCPRRAGLAALRPGRRAGRRRAGRDDAGALLRPCSAARRACSTAQ